MKYIEQLLKRQAQMASRLEQQSTPNLRIYPDAVWADAPRLTQTAEEEAVQTGAEIPSEHTAEAVYRQLVRLQALPLQNAHAAERQTEPFAARAAMAPEAGAEGSASALGAEAALQTARRGAFGILTQGRSSAHSMEQISRFFERDARRYGG